MSKDTIILKEREYQTKTSEGIITLSDENFALIEVLRELAHAIRSSK